MPIGTEKSCDTGVQLYQKFNEWWTTSGRKSEHKPNRDVFGTKIKTQKRVISNRRKQEMLTDFSMMSRSRGVGVEVLGVGVGVGVG